MSGPLKIGKAHKAFRGFLPGRPPFIPTVMLCAILLLTLALTLGLLELGAEEQVQGSPEGESALPAAAALESPSPEEEAEEGQGTEEDDEAEDSDSLSAEASSLTQEEIEAIYFREETSSLQEDASITEVEASLILESLRETFPEGKYWNHMGVEDWDELTVTDTPCQHDVYWDTYCNEYTGGIQELFPQFEPMEQCLGFAALLSDLVFGEDAPVSTFTDYFQLRVGDNIRLELSEHSMVVLTVEDDGITVVECNSDYEHCRISWDRFLSWEDLDAYSYELECITRYED